MSLNILRPQVLTTKPSAVVFDTDNTLYSYAEPHAKAMEVVESKVTRLLGIPAEAFRNAFDQAQNKVKSMLGPTASSHSRLLYFQHTIEILGMKTQILMTLDLEQTYWRTFLSNAELFSDVREFILDIRETGMQTAIITDLTSQIQFRKIIYFGLEDCFDYVVTSEETGRDKPDDGPYRLIIEKLRLPPERMWMIGDNPVNDIMGARRFNMTTLQKRHRGVTLAEGEDAADLVFDDFGELRKLIAKQQWNIA